MATFGVSMPDDLLEEVDRVASGWRSNRSQAMIRIFLEWKEAQMRQLPLAISPTSGPHPQPLSQGERGEEEVSPTVQMRANGAAELIPIVS